MVCASTPAGSYHSIRNKSIISSSCVEHSFFRSLLYAIIFQGATPNNTRALKNEASLVIFCSLTVEAIFVGDLGHDGRVEPAHEAEEDALLHAPAVLEAAEVFPVDGAPHARRRCSRVTCDVSHAPRSTVGSQRGAGGGSPKGFHVHTRRLLLYNVKLLLSWVLLLRLKALRRS